MPTLAEERAAAIKDARDIVDAAKTAERDLTAEEMERFNGRMEHVKNIDAKMKSDQAVQAALRLAGENGQRAEQDNGDGDAETAAVKSARNLGEHFVKSAAYNRMKSYKDAREVYTLGTTEIDVRGKAAGDPMLTTGFGGVRPQYGPPVPTPLRPLRVVDLLASGNLNMPALTYPVQSATQGAFAEVAENAAKPGLTFAFTNVTENLHKIAGWYKITDEAVEDTGYILAVINDQLLTRLGIAEEDAVLSGTGTAGTITGLLNRSGIQTEANAGTGGDTNFRALLRALTKVQTATYLSADGIVLNPIDYQNMRLAVDANSQFYGGGPFTGAYGNDGIMTQPGVWGYRTVVTPAVAAGTALVGAFGTAATLYRRGGVSVVSTNSDQADFISNRITIRAEERILLAVTIPAAFVKVTLL